MAGNLRFLVVEGYSRAGREDLERGGATTAGRLYARMLEACAPGAQVEVLCAADPDTSLPEGDDLNAYDGIAWTGSSLTVYHETDEVRRQIEFARAAFAAGIPGFGSCWAAQIAAVATGGHCAAHPKGREMGIARKIALTPEGRSHPLYTGKKSVFDAFISHDDEVTHLPPGGLRLAGNDYTKVQALAITHGAGSFWAVQYHPEYDLHELARLCYCRREKLVEKGFFADVPTALGFVEDLETLHQTPARRDLAWRLGIDADVMDPRIRQAEVRNWIEFLVKPARGG
jgi:GMP synthase (glutamine-hydrolysing)